MSSTIEEILQRLMISGLSKNESEQLLACFLEENAQDYVMATYLTKHNAK